MGVAVASVAATWIIFSYFIPLASTVVADELAKRQAFNNAITKVMNWREDDHEPLYAEGDAADEVVRIAKPGVFTTVTIRFSRDDK